MESSQLPLSPGLELYGSSSVARIKRPPAVYSSRPPPPVPPVPPVPLDLHWTTVEVPLVLAVQT